MAVGSISDSVNALLQRRVAEAKVRGTPSPDVEAAAVLESIGMALVLCPRAVLYAAFLARNGLLKAIQDELAQIATLTATILDLTNPTFSITDTSALSTARTALLSIESQQRINPNGPQFELYNRNVDSFLNEQLAPSVKKNGSTSLARPASEAKSDLSIDYSTLKQLHSDLIDRLYALTVGVDNFLSMPTSTILGLTASSRARSDIEAMLVALDGDSSGSNARDMAQTLIAGRAVLKSLGTAPTIDGPVIDSASKQPVGYALQGKSAAAVSLQSIGPYTLPASSTLKVTDAAGASATFGFPFTTVDAQNGAMVVGGQKSFPLTVQPGQCLFIGVTLPATYGSFVLQPNGTYSLGLTVDWRLQSDGSFKKTIRVPLNTGGTPVSLSLATILSAINTDGLGLVTALEYIQAGTGRIALVGASGVTAIDVDGSSTETDLSGPSGSFVSYSSMADVGLSIGQHGSSGNTPIQVIIDALNLLFGSKLAASSISGNNGFKMSGALNAAGSFLSFSGTAATALGLVNTTSSSDSFSLFGTVSRSAQDPVNPINLLDIGDSVSTPTGSATVESLSDTAIQLSSALQTFNGNITVTSALLLAYRAFSGSLKSWVAAWLKKPYASSLGPLDPAIASLSGAATPAQQNKAIGILNDLSGLLESLQSLLTAAGSELPSGGATNEKKVVAGITATLTERKYDKGLDYFQRLKVAELFELDYQTLSYGGSVSKAAADVGRTDLLFPNRAKDEGSEPLATTDRTGLK